MLITHTMVCRRPRGFARSLDRTIAAAVVVLVAFASARAAAEEPLTLDRALLIARAANARLPLSAVDVSLQQGRLREARAQRWFRGSVEGALVYAPPGAGSAYSDNADDYELQLVIRQPLYEGGALNGQIRAGVARVESSRARYRAAAKDLALAVASRYYEIAKTIDELKFRREGLERLRTYLLSIRDRQEAGQGVQADLFRTQVQVDRDEAAIADAERRLSLARLELNELLGRDPAATLELAPLPAPSPPGLMTDEPWTAAPELTEGRADVAAANANIAVARAERRPHLDLLAQGGIWNTGQSQTTGSIAQQLRDWAGYSVGLTLSWEIFDLGIYRARLEQAKQLQTQAEIGQELFRRQARLEWDSARASLETLYRELSIRDRAVPKARDSYLLAESLYRGGAATTLEVIDAYASWIAAEEARAETTLAYRVAQATLERWGTP